MTTLCRLILPEWAKLERPALPKVMEGLFSRKQLLKHNAEGYGVYTFPNHPGEYQKGPKPLDGTDIDVFDWVFVDCDFKDGVYDSCESFIEKLGESDITPTRIVASGGGVHAYWRVHNLDVMAYLRFQRRLARLFITDDATSSILQLMRLDGYNNTKLKDEPRPCEVLFEDLTVHYTAEELDRLLPAITAEDEAKAQQHHDKTYGIGQDETPIDEELPPKFGKLLLSSNEAKSLWAGETDDRSKADYRLGHILLAHGFTKTEALSVLINSAKALQRAPIHRRGYALNIVEKIWTYEEEPEKTKASLSPTVRDILSRGEETLTGTRFPCHKIIDDTVHGFRLGQVIGIVGGSGVGKTTLTLNTFLWFAENNPDFHHFFFSLEMPPGEIANRIRTICQGNDRLFDKIHIVGNHNEDDSFKNMGLKDVEEHLLNWQKETGAKAGAVVIDHIGVLKKATKNGENDGLIGICNQMKALAQSVNVFLIMLSQAPREKAGIGDLELNKDAAYGTVAFESYCDALLCLWQPLKRVYHKGAPTIMAFKFAKIRHKKQGRDRIQEDVCYQLFFDPETELLREMTQTEETAAKFWVVQATNARKADKKTDIVPYQSRRVEELPSATTVDSDTDSRRH